MRSTLTALCVALAAMAPALTLPAAVAPSRAPVVDNSVDHDGDGRVGEGAAILARIRNYLERHGDNGEVTSEAMAARTRWAYQRYLEKHQPGAKGIDGNGWVSLGPNNGAGRCTAVVPHPVEPDTVLAGAAGGGVWKSTDSGLTWRSLTDGLISDLSVGALAYAPSDPNVLYLGTGEGGYAIDFIPGIGLLRSEDGGETWILPPYSIASMMFAISVDPRDADSLLVATDYGLAASSDGGVTWAFPLIVSGVSGVTEVIRSASNPDLVYTALWCTAGCPQGYARVMRSTDNGLTWTPAGAGLPATNSGDYSLNRNSLTVSAADDQILTLGLNLAGSGNEDPPARVYRSTDGGDSWTMLAQTAAYLGLQGWYDNTITTKPTDPNTIVAGGVYYVVSANGGTSWQVKNPYAGTPNLPHVDAHDLQWQGNTLWVACDGGIWRSTNDGQTWHDCNAGLITRQYYALAVDPVNRERVIAGSQDNGTDRRRDSGDDSWDPILGGDGFECAINPLLPEIAYATIYNTFIARSTTGGAGGWVDVSPSPGVDDTPFITPLTMRPESPWVLYTGTSRVFRTEDTGDSWVALPTSVENGGWSGEVVWAVAVTPADPQVLMVAKNTTLYRSSDGGQSWLRAPQGAGGLPNRRVNNVEISPFDADLAVACIAGQANGHLFRTADGGLTWQQSDTGLPPFSVQVARWDPTDPAVVYAGTDVGVYRSLDAGLTWAEYGDGLPAVSVHDVRILPDGSMLRVATHGRGVWELTIPRPANSAPTVAITSPTTAPTVNVGASVDFTATASDSDGDPLTVRWVTTDEWEGTVATGTGSVTTSFTDTFDVGGMYQVVAQATDSHGAVSYATLWVLVLDPADSCTTPRVLPGGGPFPVEIRTSNMAAGRATTDPMVTCAASAADPGAGAQASLWFELTPAVSARYSLSTCGSMPDPVLSVWTGDACGPYTAVTGACDDDDELAHCTGRRTDSYLQLDLVAGETYRILVGSWRSDLKGTVRLNVDCADCVAPPVGVDYLVPAAAHNPGLDDTTWVTDLHLHNPGVDDVEALLSFLPSGGDNSDAQEYPVEAPAAGSVELHDVVATLFEAEGSGAIRVNAEGALVIASRTYTTAEEGGTFGQYIAGLPVDQATVPGSSALLIGLERSTEFRTNIGLASTSASAGSAAVELYAASGTLLSTRDFALYPYGFLQVTDIFEAQGHSQVDDGYALVRNTSTGAPFFAYASVVDKRTGDPVAVTATDSSRPDAPLWIAAAAHNPGVGGTVWRTDLELVNIGATDLVAEVALLGADQDNTEPPTAHVTVRAAQAVRLEDVVGSVFGASGAGALRVSVDSNDLTVTSRTFNLTSDGTFGQYIPGVTSARAIGSGGTGALVQLRRSAAFRTNVGVVNLTGSAITIQASFHGSDGSLLGNATYALPPFAYHQTTNAIPGAGDVAGGFAVLSSTSPGALFLAYASVVDEESGDPVFVPIIAVD